MSRAYNRRRKQARDENSPAYWVVGSLPIRDVQDAELAASFTELYRQAALLVVGLHPTEPTDWKEG